MKCYNFVGGNGMLIKIGLENQAGSRSTAISLDYPGLFSYGRDGPDALVHVPEAVIAYKDWLDKHSPDHWLKDLKDFDIRLVETFEMYTINENYEPVKDGYEVNGWFLHDWKVLTRMDVQRAQKLLEWSREDLLEIVKNLNQEQLDRTFPGERWSIRGILGHVANAEAWYLNRLDMMKEKYHELPEDVFYRLELVRSRLNEALPQFEGLEKVTGKKGEFWSPRKVIRRAVWHELDHVEHIRKLKLAM